MLTAGNWEPETRNQPMTEFAGLTIIFGAVLAMLYAPCVLVPERTISWVRLFPRNKPSAWLLTAIDLAWVSYLLVNMPLGRFDFLKSYIYIIAPVAFFLIVFLMNDLLAPRALGGLMLLLPAPLLDAGRWHESNFRYIVIVLAYIIAVKGMILVLSPYKFRKAMAFWFRSEKACRGFGIAGAITGLLLVCLGMLAF